MARWKANLGLLLAAAIWGGAFIVVKDALNEAEPLTFLALRFSISSIFLILLFPRVLAKTTREEALAGILIGLFAGIGFITQTIGLQYTTAGKSGFITGFYIPLTPIFAALLFRMGASWLQVVGVFISLAGLALLSVHEDFSIGVGEQWTMVCAVFFALQVVAIAYYAQKHSPFRLVFWQIFSVAIMTTVGAFLCEEVSLSFSAKTWGEILFSSLFPTILAFWLQIKMQRFTSATHAALILGLEAPFAAFFGWLILNEILAWHEWVGCVLMVVGFLIAEIRWKRVH